MNKLFITALALSSTVSFADTDLAFLDPQYKDLIHPKVSKITNKSSITKSDTKAVIARQSRVKSQEARGTCSIFSATAYLEGLIDNSLDLSEEWLEYTAIRGNTSDGSRAPRNFDAIKSYGMPSEQTLPYIGEDWVKVYNPLKGERCGHLTDEYKKLSCLVVHFDPALLTQTNVSDVDFANARAEAFAFRDQYLHFQNASYYLFDTDVIRAHLNNGRAVVLEIDFYYGAWNHRLADDYGIGRDLDHWSKGIVTSPEYNSVDLAESSKHRAGHSVLVVGYDDNRIVTKTIKMTDGTMKTFTYKGVYYFKNSWGTEGFGRNFEIDGENFPGYGMIVQKHANQEGAFYALPEFL